VGDKFRYTGLGRPLGGEGISVRRKGDGHVEIR
jgi:hypothetical protein